MDVHGEVFDVILLASNFGQQSRSSAAQSLHVKASYESHGKLEMLKNWHGETCENMDPGYVSKVG